MEVYIAGGCSEHGRSCYFVRGSRTAFLVDCGIMEGDSDNKPSLNVRQIQEAQYLFLTHSHLDHVGALGWLYECGFKGEVILSKETFRQLQQKVIHYRFVEEVQQGEVMELSGELSMKWGRSGHCAGSVWYHFLIENRKILFSGDYCEHSITYPCDALKGKSASLAVIDCAYALESATAYDSYSIFCRKVRASLDKGRDILLPVPKYGRGLDLIHVLGELKGKIFVDEMIWSQLEQLGELAGWINEGCKNMLGKLSIYPLWKYGPSDDHALIFVSDPQLVQKKNQELCKELMDGGGNVIFSGNCDDNSYSKRLLDSGKAYFCRWPVHLCLDDVQELKNKNYFSRIILSHCKNTYSDIKLEKEYLVPENRDVVYL